MTATIVPPHHEATPPPFLLSIDVPAGRIAIHGDFDRDQLAGFLDAVQQLEDSPAPSLSVDVSTVTFCDAGGLRGLLAAQRVAAQTGHTFRVIRAGRWMRRLLPMVGLAPFDDSRVLSAVP
jgi:ABC-type transporter Mla MlaB component